MSYPAGYSDFETSSSYDSDDEYFGPLEPRTSKKGNGQPLNANTIINRRDLENAEKFLCRLKLSPCDFGDFLVKCCFNGWTAGVKLLLDNVPESYTQQFKAPLTACCQGSGTEQERKECAELLVEKGADVNLACNYQTPLISAAYCNSVELVKFLLEQPNILLEERDVYGETALLVAAKKHHRDIVQLLLESGADAQCCDRNGLTYLELLKEEEEVNADVVVDVKVSDVFKDPEHRDIPKAPVTELKFLKELPDDCGNGGFYSDAVTLIRSAGYPNVDLNLSLPSLLTANEENLKKNQGILVKAFRSSILNEVHQFHLKAWSPESLPLPSFANLDEVLEIYCNLVKQLTIMNASLEYVRMHLPNAQLMYKADFMETLCNTMKEAKKVGLRLKRYKTLIDEKYVGPCRPPDYVFPRRWEREERKYLNKYSWLFIPLLVAFGIKAFKLIGNLL